MRSLFFLAAFAFHYDVGCECLPRGPLPVRPDAGESVDDTPPVFTAGAFRINEGLVRAQAHRVRPGLEHAGAAHDLSSNTLDALAGVPGLAGQVNSPDGTLGTNANISTIPSNAAWDAVGSRWVFFNPGEPRLIRALAVGGTLSMVASLQSGITAFALRRVGGVHRLYVCRSGVLAQFDVVAGSETLLPWPIPRMRCTGKGLVYSASRGSLLVPFTLDGVGGIAEYFTP